MQAGATAEISPTTNSSEEVFRRGLAHLKRRAHKEAAASFQQAIDLSREGAAKAPPMKCISYLGLALSMIDGRSEEAVKLCRQALNREFFDADLLCNLGIVYLRNRQRGPAFDAFARGLKMQPDHYRILTALERTNRRAEPIFGFLSRDHPLNRIAGRLRWRLRRRLNRSPDSHT